VLAVFRTSDRPDEIGQHLVSYAQGFTSSVIKTSRKSTSADNKCGIKNAKSHLNHACMPKGSLPPQISAIELAGGDERGQASPVLGSFVVACEQ